MKNLRVTLASLPSLLGDVEGNLNKVSDVCRRAAEEDARMVFLPELMLTGHGGHASMVQAAEPIPDGSLCQHMIRLSKEFDLCLSVGMAEVCDGLAYNSQIVVDRGNFLGVQRKMCLSGDEYCYFAAGSQLETFQIDEVRFGILICYDNLFPELAWLLSLKGVDLILAPHAARVGAWPEQQDATFKQRIIDTQQDAWRKVHCARAYDHNVYVLLNNAVGSATEKFPEVVANHAGGVMVVGPGGDVLHGSQSVDWTEEIVTVDLSADRVRFNHAPKRNRNVLLMEKLLADCIQENSTSGSQSGNPRPGC